MGKKERNRRKDEEEQGTPSWLLTYADMITLVLTFFILLYTMSSIDVIKFSQVVTSLKGSLGIMDGGKTIIIEPNEEIGTIEPDIWELIKEMEEEDAVIKEAIKKIEDLLESEGIQDVVYVVVDQRGIHIRFLDHVLFDLGRADLKAEAKPMLSKLVSVLKELNNEIKVEGYTDDLPISTAQFPSNWELSTRRATTVVRFLEDKGILGRLLTAVGYGEHRPLVPNTSESNRQQNRRVDIILLRESIR